MQVGGAEKQTTVVSNDLNPTWNETLSFIGAEPSASIQLECWDKVPAPLSLPRVAATALTRELMAWFGRRTWASRTTRWASGSPTPSASCAQIAVPLRLSLP